ncbi:hypothetical protein VMA_003262 [Vibrio mimicus VM223]|nr:hypothetical protein VMA_003262 [Vibrio mimicus VM223]
MGETTQAQLMPVVGTAASIFGIWLEMRSEQDASEQPHR